METLQVRIERLAVGGELVGKVEGTEDSRAGKTAFIAGVAPGELVLAKIIEEKSKFLRAELVEVLEPSAARITPPCPWFGSCGGCSLQHLELEQQRKLKLEMVLGMLVRQAGGAPREGVLLEGVDLPGYAYRTRISLHMRGRKLGFFSQRSNEVVPVDSCMLAVPQLNQAFMQIQQCCGRLAGWVGGVTIELQGDEVFVLLSVAEGVKLSPAAARRHATSLRVKFPNLAIKRGRRLCWQQVGELEMEPSQESLIGRFSQVNEAGNQVLQRLIGQAVRGGAITELYAGSGNFTIPLALAGADVQAVEIDPVLCEAGLRRADQAGVSQQVHFHTMSTARYLKRGSMNKVVVLDPPRSGAPEFAQSCEPEQTDTIVYVSCSLPTLARDISWLRARGYELEKTVLVDMFPQTHHVETVSVLRSV